MLAIAYAVSGSAYDFYAFDSAGLVYNGSDWVAWDDVDFEGYRIPAAESGTSGRFVATLPGDTARYAMRASGADLAGSYLVWEEAVDAGGSGALTPEQAAWLEAIHGKTALIGTGMATVSAPVTSEGGIDYLIVGDSYTGGRALEWKAPVGTFGDLTDWTAKFTASRVACGDETTLGPIDGAVNNAGLDSQSVTFGLSSVDTSVPAGTYRWSAYVEKDAEKLTLAHGQFAFRKSP